MSQEENLNNIKKKILDMLTPLIVELDYRLNKIPHIKAALPSNYGALLHRATVFSSFLSSENINDQIEILIKSSKSLENLTKTLIVLTIVLIILTIVLTYRTFIP